jgi:hypothetical protein
MDDTPAPSAPLEKASRLNAALKRQLKARITELVAAGAAITLLRVREVAAELLGLDISKTFAEKLLTEFGYRMGNDLEPVLGEGGAMNTVHVWELAPVARPLTPAEKAQALADRLKLLTDAFVEDLMEDPLLKFAGLDDIATEATRSFSLALGAAVSARARVGARTILPACADTAQLTFKAVLQARD